MAEKVVYSKASILIGFSIHFGDSLLERLRTINEPARELSADEVQKFMRLQGFSGQIGPGDELNTTNMPPVRSDCSKQSLTLLVRKKREAAAAGEAAYLRH